MSIKIRFSENLDHLMQLSKLSHKGMGDAVGIGSGTINQYVNGKTFPNVINLVRLAEHFKIGLDALVFGDLTRLEDLAQVNDVEVTYTIEENESDNHDLVEIIKDQQAELKNLIGTQQQQIERLMNIIENLTKSKN